MPEGNNNVIKMRTLGKEEEPSEKKPPEEESNDENPSPVSYYRLFRFASPTELGMAFVGVLSAIVGGCSMPFMVIMYGELANAFVEQVYKRTQGGEDMAHLSFSGSNRRKLQFRELPGYCAQNIFLSHMKMQKPLISSFTILSKAMTAS